MRVSCATVNHTGKAPYLAKSNRVWKTAAEQLLSLSPNKINDLRVSYGDIKISCVELPSTAPYSLGQGLQPA